MFEDFRKFHRLRKPFEVSALDSMASKYNWLNPYILEERQLNVTQLDIFSRLMMDRILFFGTEVNADTANIAVSQLLYLDNLEPGKDILMYINSPGGEVYSGYSILDTMDFIESPVGTTCTGMAASMGAVLLLCGEKGKRSALKHSRVMIHQPLGGCSGQASDIEIEAREILKLRKELNEMIADKTGQSLEVINKDTDRDHWLTAEEAKAYGIIDEVITKTSK